MVVITINTTDVKREVLPEALKTGKKRVFPRNCRS
jgi:hypothetical protein